MIYNNTYKKERTMKKIFLALIITVTFSSLFADVEFLSKPANTTLLKKLSPALKLPIVVPVKSAPK